MLIYSCESQRNRNTVDKKIDKGRREDNDDTIPYNKYNTAFIPSQENHQGMARTPARMHDTLAWKETSRGSNSYKRHIGLDSI